MEQPQRDGTGAPCDPRRERERTERTRLLLGAVDRHLGQALEGLDRGRADWKLWARGAASLVEEATEGLDRCDGGVRELRRIEEALRLAPEVDDERAVQLLHSARVALKALDPSGTRVA